VNVLLGCHIKNKEMENFLTFFLYPFCAMLSTIALWGIALNIEKIREKM
jgi:hypothetical protein